MTARKKAGMSAAAWFATSDFHNFPSSHIGPSAPQAKALNAINVGQVLMAKADDVTPAEIARTLVVVIEENEALRATLRRMTAERDQAIAERDILREQFKRDSELLAEGGQS